MNEKEARVTEQDMKRELEIMNFTIDERFDHILATKDMMECNLVNSDYDSALECAIEIMHNINIMRMEDIE